MSHPWPTSKLGECSEIVSGATPSTSVDEFWNGDICWATPKDLSELDGKYISETPRKITAAGLKSCAASILPPYSVLFSSRAPIGHVAINTVPMATNQGFKSLVPVSDRADPNYLYWWLRTNRPYLESLGNGATFKEVSKRIVSEVQIPLPPVEEQRRIAAILDQAEALRAKRRAALAKLDTLTQSVFLEMFGPRTALTKRWPTGHLGALAKTGSGGTPNRSNPAYFGGSVPWVKSGELRGGVILSTEESITELALRESSAKLRPPGTVLVAMYGATVGALAVLGIEAATNQAICCIQPSEQLDTPFLVAFLNTIKSSLLAQRVGGAQPNLSQEMLRNLVVPVPPISLQHEFARRVEAVERLKADQRASLAKMDELFASLQQRAFRGEL